MTCVTKPVSWLRLEQYQLGELTPSVREAVARHLEACPDCAACAEAIAADRRALPRLPEPAPAPTIFTWPRLVIAGGMAAAAVALGLLFVPSMREGESTSPEQVRYRGGETAMTIARERDGDVVENPAIYRSGDRFRLFATVAGRGSKAWDVVVFQGDEVFFPLTPDDGLLPGNNIPLPGAFRVTGNEAIEICLMVGETVPGRTVLAREGKNALPENAVCRTIEAEGE